jgi:hypothetical protein
LYSPLLSKALKAPVYTFLGFVNVAIAAFKTHLEEEPHPRLEEIERKKKNDTEEDLENNSDT